MVSEARDNLPKLGLGIVGLGGAFQLMLPSFAAHPYLNVVSAASGRAEARERFESEFDGKSYPTLEEMCRDKNVDVVYIASSHVAHAEQAIMCARAGKHIIVEKPVGLTIEECQEVVNEVEKCGVKLIVGHTSSFDGPILKIREIITSGDVGRLRLINTFHYTDFLYRPRRADELDPKRGGGILFNQTPHQVDVVRLIGGGLIRSVRATNGIWDDARPVEGASSAFLEFEDGAVATIVYSGYAHLDGEEFWGREINREQYGAARKSLKNFTSVSDEAARKASVGYGAPRQREWKGRPPARRHEHFGMTIVSCDKADIRPSYEGVTVYRDEEIEQIPVPFGRGGFHRSGVIDELFDAVVLGKPLIHDVRWGLATLEVCLAIRESSQQRKEVYLSHQTATPD